MKKLFILFLAAAALMLPAKELKVLMIGNSYSICVGQHLPQVVKSVPGCKLHLVSAFIGSCSLDKHWANIGNAQKDPAFKPYRVDTWTGDGKQQKRYMDNVNNLLKLEKWDIITIQQVSSFSWRPSTFQPAGDNLIGFIRKNAPQAEIIVQQTWSYRSDNSTLKLWNLDNQKMYEKLRNAYAVFAARHNLRIIPMGDAVQIYRNESAVKYIPPTKEELASYHHPDRPRSAGDAVGYYYYIKNPKTSEMELTADRIHLNDTGTYMQACLWFSFLYGKDVDEIKYVPSFIGKSSDKFIKYCVKKALSGKNTVPPAAKVSEKVSSAVQKSDAPAATPAAPGKIWPLFDENLTFYQSFNDGDSADICQSNPKPVLRLGKSAFADGLYGKAMICGKGGGALRYQRKGNMNFDNPGTVVFFYKPLDWEKDHNGKLPRCNFWAIESMKGYIGVQGANDPKNICMCERQLHIMLLYGKRIKNTVLTFNPVTPNTQRCKNWHMISFAWAGDKLYLKFDKEDLKQFEFPQQLKESDFPANDFTIGAASIWRYLMDEFMIYNRKLSDNELNSIFDALIK